MAWYAEHKFSPSEAEFVEDRSGGTSVAYYIRKRKTAEDASFSSDLRNLLNDVRLMLLDVDTPTREQRSDIVHRISKISERLDKI